MDSPPTIVVTSPVFTPPSPERMAPTAGGAQSPTPLTREDKRALAVAELLSTERTFVSEMSVLVGTFLEPLNRWSEELRASSNDDDDEEDSPRAKDLSSLTPEDCKLIFSNVSAIAALNRQFLGDLEAAEVKEGAEGMLRTLIKFAPLFKMYSSYTNHFDKARAHLAMVRTRPAVQAFIRACEMQPACHGLGLSDFLIQPVQRIPRYRLLLETMLKFTSMEDALHESLQRSLEQISHVATKINDDVHAREAQDKILELQSEFGDSFAEPSRLFLREGLLEKVSRNGLREHKFVLFNDLLVYGEERGFVRRGGGIFGSTRTRLYKTNRRLPLDSIYVVAATSYGDKTSTPLGETGFMVVTASKSFVVQAETAAEKDAWVQAVRDAMSELSAKDKARNQHRYGEDAASVRRGMAQSSEIWVWMQGKDGRLNRTGFLLPPSALSAPFGVLSFSELIMRGGLNDGVPSGNSGPATFSSQGSDHGPLLELSLRSQLGAAGDDDEDSAVKQFEVEIKLRPKSDRLGLRLKDVVGGGAIVCSFLSPACLAKRAGIELGDMVTHMNGVPVTSGEQVAMAVKACAGFDCALRIGIKRGLGTPASPQRKATPPHNFGEVGSGTAEVESQGDSPPGYSRSVSGSEGQRQLPPLPPPRPTRPPPPPPPPKPGTTPPAQAPSIVPEAEHPVTAEEPEDREEGMTVSELRGMSAADMAGRGMSPATPELYLTLSEFQSAFGMSREKFAAQPLWKRTAERSRVFSK